MEGCTIYYEDARPACTALAEKLAEHENISIQKASDFQQQTFIYESNPNVGFIFESEKEKNYPSLRNVIPRMVMNKSNYIFIAVTGGVRELESLVAVNADLEKRGYHADNVYSRNIFEKHHMNQKEIISKIINDMEAKETNYSAFQKRVDTMSKKDLRKILKHGYQSYR
ncbi:hypothetical protein INP51_08370 [Blautia liquoris]|uniref:Uncharacterized protein n=1 Tax=Blautia liquoris TaxID=2779518 RepID=A0A7M2RFB7_9FIRM|nr:hypothetical protein [Blautia liquoris]QOV18072.1 hypothetical protein INP51_08370 [Blautia liquoris]